MATHRSYSCILIYIFALLLSCWISATQSQILATSSSYAASYVYDNKGIIGSFFGSHIPEDTLILSVTNGLVVFDLASRNCTIK
jgi:predicted acyltransferase